MAAKETSGVSGKYELEKKNKQTNSPGQIYGICGRPTRRILSTLVPDLSRRALNAVEHSIKHGTRHG